MTDQEIQETYGELEKMFVRLDPDATRGLDYVRDRLMLCRAMQDRLVEVQLRVNRAVSKVVEKGLIAQQQCDVMPDPGLKKQMGDLEREKQKLSMLAKMVKAQYTLLGRTSMDIRLLADLTKEQIKLGEVDPKQAGLVQQKTPGDIVPFTADQPGAQTVASPPADAKEWKCPECGGDSLWCGHGKGHLATVSPATPFHHPPNSQTVGPTQVGFGAPAENTADDPITLPKDDTVSFDSLFEETPHGQTRSDAPF